MADKSDPDPAVKAVLKTHRLALVFNQARNASHVQNQVVHNRSVDPSLLPPGTWVIRFHDMLHVNVNGQNILGPVENESRLIMIAERIFSGRKFAQSMAEVSLSLKHDGRRPVIQMPAGAYNFNSEDLSGQYKIVPKGVQVIGTSGQHLWPPFRDCV